MQLGAVHLGRVRRLLLGRRRRVRALQEALPHGVLREGLRATLVDQTLHDLVLGGHGAEDAPAGHLAVGGLGPVAAVQTWEGGADKPGGAG